MESIAPWDGYRDDLTVTQEYIDGAWGGLEELARRCSELLTHKRRRETMPDNRRFDYLTGLWKTYSAPTARAITCMKRYTLIPPNPGRWNTGFW